MATMRPPARGAPELDETDLRILAELQADGRMTNVELARRADITAPPCLRRVRRLTPHLELVLLLKSPTQWWRARPLAEEDWLAGPGIEVLREHPDFVRRLVRSGTRVHCWVVNTEDDLELCLDLGVEALITDLPAATVTYLAKRVSSV